MILTQEVKDVSKLGAYEYFVLFQDKDSGL